MWEQIEAVVPREELAAAIAALFELAPPLDSDADEAWRAMLVTRFATVRPFLKLLVGSVHVARAAFRQQFGRHRPAPDVRDGGRHLGGDRWSAVCRPAERWGKSAGYGRRWHLPRRRCRVSAGASRSRVLAHFP